MPDSGRGERRVTAADVREALGLPPLMQGGVIQDMPRPQLVHGLGLCRPLGTAYQPWDLTNEEWAPWPSFNRLVAPRITEALARLHESRVEIYRAYRCLAMIFVHTWWAILSLFVKAPPSAEDL